MNIEIKFLIFLSLVSIISVSGCTQYLEGIEPGDIAKEIALEEPEVREFIEDNENIGVGRSNIGEDTDHTDDVDLTDRCREKLNQNNKAYRIEFRGDKDQLIVWLEEDPDIEVKCIEKGSNINLTEEINVTTLEAEYKEPSRFILSDRDPKIVIKGKRGVFFDTSWVGFWLEYGPEEDNLKYTTERKINFMSIDISFDDAIEDTFTSVYTGEIPKEHFDEANYYRAKARGRGTETFSGEIKKIPNFEQIE